MLYRIVFILIALLDLTTIKASKRPFDLNLQITCDFLPPLVKHYACDIQKLAVSRYAINVMFQLTRQMPMDTEFGIIVNMKPFKGLKFVKLFDVKLKVCDILTNALTIPMMKEVWHEVRRSSNLPMTCPIKGNTMYNVTNLSFTNEVIPTYARNIEFNATLSYYQKKKLLATFCFYGSTVERK